MQKKSYELIKTITEQLRSVHEPEASAQAIAWWIVEWLTGKTHAELLLQPDIQLTANQAETLDQILHEHLYQHKPLQYIFGSVPFLDLTIQVTPPILIPRPETEYWCSLLIQAIKTLENKEIKILDLCTGTGCIALALARAFPEVEVYAIDINPDAIKLARVNSKTNQVANITILESNLFEKLPKQLRFDIICANPPYISNIEWEALDPSVKKWEDARALVSENHGLALIEKIIQESSEWLSCNAEFLTHNIPQLWLEIGYKQADNVKKILEQNGFSSIAVIQDLAGKDRVLTAGVSACGFLKNRKT